MNQTDIERFNTIRNEILDKERAMMGIGTLSEKSIHAVLKRFYAVLPEYQEQKVAGYVADIFDGKNIIEIQTRHFHTLRRKLDAFLPEHEVKIVFPINHIKYLRWIDESTGEISKPRKSPKQGNPISIFPELYRIKMYLDNPRLHFIIVSVDVEEYRILNGWSKDKKKGSTRNDGIPLSIADEFHIDCVQDYLQFLPASLPEEFTTDDYHKHAHVSRVVATVALNIMNHVGIIKRTGKRGNSYIYTIPDIYMN